MFVFLGSWNLCVKSVTTVDEALAAKGDRQRYDSFNSEGTKVMVYGGAWRLAGHQTTKIR